MRPVNWLLSSLRTERWEQLWSFEGISPEKLFEERLRTFTQGSHSHMSDGMVPDSFLLERSKLSNSVQSSRPPGNWPSRPLSASRMFETLSSEHSIPTKLQTNPSWKSHEDKWLKGSFRDSFIYFKQRRSQDVSPLALLFSGNHRREWISKRIAKLFMAWVISLIQVRSKDTNSWKKAKRLGPEIHSFKIRTRKTPQSQNGNHLAVTNFEGIFILENPSPLKTLRQPISAFLYKPSKFQRMKMILTACRKKLSWHPQSQKDIRVSKTAILEVWYPFLIRWATRGLRDY